ncbi:hypothetical protein P8452_39275 [Trifolium repens]|nr:hypothetical protein P8452_39275 [Trifolium repens]
MPHNLHVINLGNYYRFRPYWCFGLVALGNILFLHFEDLDIVNPENIQLLMTLILKHTMHLGKFSLVATLPEVYTIGYLFMISFPANAIRMSSPVADAIKTT